jgi:hypothetical protein
LPFINGRGLSRLDGLRQVEAKYPALLFKQQLTAFHEKLYGMIRDNLKKEISPLLGLCIQVKKYLTFFFGEMKIQILRNSHWLRGFCNGPIVLGFYLNVIYEGDPHLTSRFCGLCTCVRAQPQILRYLYNNHNLYLFKLNKIYIIYRDPQTQEFIEAHCL